jgi:rubrerythrin
MTVEEAKDFLIDMSYKLGNMSIEYLTEKDGEKMREAIKALEQENIGCWIKTPKAVMGEGYMWFCDNCEYQVYQDSSRPYPSEKYCPNCGAKMKK